MARTVVVQVTDSLTGRTVSTFDGYILSMVPADYNDETGEYTAREDAETVTWNADLSTQSAAAFTELFINDDNSKLVTVLKSPGSGSGNSDGRAKEIRAWAKAQTDKKQFPWAGTIGDQGKLSDDVVKAFDASTRTIPADASPAGHSTK